MNRDDDAISDEELTAAAVTLATLEDGAPLPARVRERVEASGRRVLGERAKHHALRRAFESNASSTTSAGSQVMVAIHDAAPAPPRRLGAYAWRGGAALAAAAAVMLVVRSRIPSPATGGAVHDVERIEVGDASGMHGELRYDRGDGTGVFTLAQAPAVTTTEGERLQLWIAFEGDTAPRPVALLFATSLDVAFGAVCRPGPASRCAPVQEVFVTREDTRGAFTFVAERTLLRGKAPER